MDKKYIEENEIEIKYLRKQLSEQELEEFEVYLMDNPSIVETLHLESVLIEDAGLTVKATSTKGVNFFEKMLSLFINPIVIRTFLSSLLTLGLGVLVGGWLNTSQLNGSSLELIEFEVSRSVNEPAKFLSELVVSSSDLSFFSKSQFALVLDSGSFEQALFNVEIKKKGESMVFIDYEIIENVKSNYEGAVILPLLVRSFPPNDYQIRLISTSSPSKKKEFYLTVVQEK